MAMKTSHELLIEGVVRPASAGDCLSVVLSIQLMSLRVEM